MPDLDQLLDTLVADVRSKTRAPGASTAIKQAHRRRTVLSAAAAVAAVAVIAAGSALSAGTLGGRAQLSPISEPTMPSSESPTMQTSAESPDCSYAESPDCSAAFDRELDEILGQVSGWAVNERLLDDTPLDFVINGPCEGNWRDGATGGGHGSAGNLAKGLYHARWPSEAQASDAAGRLVENLASCDKTAWRTGSIAQQPGAVLASSAQAVVWIQQTRTDVWVLQVLSTDGPPPADVQVAAAEWMVDYIDWKWVD